MATGDFTRRSPVPQIARVQPLVLVGLGGATGSLVRHGVVSTALDPTLAVFLLNVAGSLILGALTAWLQHAGSPWHGPAGEAKRHWSSLLGLGFCGGLTTFSTHMVDVATRLDGTHRINSASSALVSLFGVAGVAIAAAVLGYEGTRRRSTRTSAGERGGNR